jgi:hypothetical protein
MLTQGAERLTAIRISALNKAKVGYTTPLQGIIEANRLFVIFRSVFGLVPMLGGLKKIAQK